jgi:hypothetical protein
MQQSSLLIRGFEPTRQVNESQLGSAQILPALVEQLIVSRHADSGFTLEDAVTMIATLEQVISNSERHLLEAVYKEQQQSPQELLSHENANSIIETYMVHWTASNDEKLVRLLMERPEKRNILYPHWDEMTDFAHGMLFTTEFTQQHLHKQSGSAAFALGHSFDDVHKAVGGITRTFASYWEAECQMIKSSLVALDKTGTGRVALADFYGANSDGNWRFGESEAYLRELGALDESSAWRGKQVIIPNYLLGASNCIVTTPHYLVCCVNECESILNEIEDASGAPTAVPDDVLSLVSGMADFNDDPPKVGRALCEQLHRIAETHGGRVPLHGRLFAQWLHYVFPRECPFPHKAGSFSALAPKEFGEYLASDGEVDTYASKRSSTENQEIVAEEREWMSQWSEEEELHADYSEHLTAPWESSRITVGSGFLVLAALAFLTIGSRASGSGLKGQSTYSYDAKAHFV